MPTFAMIPRTQTSQTAAMIIARIFLTSLSMATRLNATRSYSKTTINFNILRQIQSLTSMHRKMPPSRKRNKN